MNRSLALAALAVLLPLAAHADAMLDRYIAASTTQAEAMQSFLVSRVPDLADVLPPTEWGDEEVAVAQCTLDGIRDARGEAGVEEFVAATEMMAATPITSFGSIGAGAPEILTDDLSMQLTQDCGGMELAMRQMQESGLMEKLQDPAIMQALMATE